MGTFETQKGTLGVNMYHTALANQITEFSHMTYTPVIHPCITMR